MHFPLVLRSLPFLPVSHGYATPEPAAINHHYGPPGGNYYARRANISTATLSNSNGSTSTVTILTFVTPSPSAAPIPITSQSQLVTSYIAISTICPTLPSAATGSVLAYSSALASAPSSVSVSSYVPVSNTTPLNHTFASNTSLPLLKRQPSTNQNLTIPVPTGIYPNATVPTGIYANTKTPPTISSAAPPTCSTIYSPTITPICITTLTPLGAPLIPITACAQNITFSTDHGYTSSISLTTKLFANWDAVATGVPTGPVWGEVCGSEATCETIREMWDGRKYIGDVETGEPTTTYSRTSTRMRTVTVVPTAA